MPATGGPAEPGPFVRTFAPESWGEAEKFVRFASFTYEFREAQARALEGVVGHFAKAVALKRVARRLEEGLAMDREEARTQGYSDARLSEEFAAVVEEIFGELYACLDCTRQVLKAVYPKAQGLPKDKTSRLFENAASGKLDSMVPGDIRHALVKAHGGWFRNLRRIRTAVTHLSPGDCSINEEKGKVAYFSRALGRSGNSLEIADLWRELERYLGAVNDLLGTVFHELNTTLEVWPSHLEARSVSSERVMYACHSPPQERNCSKVQRAWLDFLNIESPVFTYSIEQSRVV